MKVHQQWWLRCNIIPRDASNLVYQENVMFDLRSIPPGFLFASPPRNTEEVIHQLAQNMMLIIFKNQKKKESLAVELGGGDTDWRWLIRNPEPRVPPPVPIAGARGEAVRPAGWQGHHRQVQRGQGVRRGEGPRRHGVGLPALGGAPTPLPPHRWPRRNLDSGVGSFFARVFTMCGPYLLFSIFSTHD